MKPEITWLGQSGFLLEDGQSSIVIDPYFSDSVSRIRPEFKRPFPVPDKYIRSYDLLLFTHCHLDHTDPETVEILKEKNPDIIMAGPRSSRDKVKEFSSGGHFNIMRSGAGMDFGKWEIRALPAYHTDKDALGYFITNQNFSLYFTGDSVLTGQLLEDAPRNPDIMFVCVNGAGNNMDANDAIRLAKSCLPHTVIPCHFGMFPQDVDLLPFRMKIKDNGLKSEIMETFKTVSIADLKK